jgi:hypothetical protein
MNSNTVIWLALGGGVLWYLMSKSATPSTTTTATPAAAVTPAIQAIVASNPAQPVVTNTATGTTSVVSTLPPGAIGIASQTPGALSGLGRWAA